MPAPLPPAPQPRMDIPPPPQANGYGPPQGSYPPGPPPPPGAWALWHLCMQHAQARAHWAAGCVTTDCDHHWPLGWSSSPHPARTQCSLSLAVRLGCTASWHLAALPVTQRAGERCASAIAQQPGRLRRLLPASRAADGQHAAAAAQLPCARGRAAAADAHPWRRCAPLPCRACTRAGTVPAQEMCQHRRCAAAISRGPARPGQCLRCAARHVAAPQQSAVPSLRFQVMRLRLGPCMGPGSFWAPRCHLLLLLSCPQPVCVCQPCHDVCRRAPALGDAPETPAWTGTTPLAQPGMRPPPMQYGALLDPASQLWLCRHRLGSGRCTGCADLRQARPDISIRLALQVPRLPGHSPREACQPPRQATAHLQVR